jgi:outer membrane beta-barrel protein
MNLNADLNLQATRRSTKDKPMNMKPNCGHRRHRLSGLLVALAMTAVPLAAQAQRKSPLADAPAIRKRYELRATRLELGAGLGTTLNQDFYHTMFLNLKVGFHITDWLSLSAFGGFAVANIATTFQNDLVSSLHPTDMGQPINEPLRTQATASMQKISSILGAQLEFTPFTGKYSLAGKLFANYDFYAFGGPGLINVAPTDASSLTDCGSIMQLPPTASGGPGGPFSCKVSGAKFGANFGVGLHSYFNEWMALNVELRDILAQLNPSGRDNNGDGVANANDLTWSHTFMVTANIVFYLPSTASISP